MYNDFIALIKHRKLVATAFHEDMTRYCPQILTYTVLKSSKYTVNKSSKL